MPQTSSDGKETVIYEPVKSLSIVGEIAISTGQRKSSKKLPTAPYSASHKKSSQIASSSKLQPITTIGETLTVATDSLEAADKWSSVRKPQAGGITPQQILTVKKQQS